MPAHAVSTGLAIWRGLLRILHNSPPASNIESDTKNQRNLGMAGLLDKLSIASTERDSLS